MLALSTNAAATNIKQLQQHKPDEAATAAAVAR